MSTKKLIIEIKMQVLKPIEEVFEAIVNPEHMCNYFIAESTGIMQEGVTLEWKFPEFDVVFPVKVNVVEPYHLINFTWDATEDVKTNVEFKLSSFGDNATVIVITEKEMENNEAGLKWMMENSGGWANFLTCLKAYLEYGINLRKGGFDFMMVK